LAVIDCKLHVDFWLSFGLDGVWNFLEVMPVFCSLKSVLKILELLGVIELLGSSWVKVTEVIEVLLSKTLSLSILHFWFVERVVDNLESFPVTLAFQKFVHMLLCCSIAVFHDPSVERDEPDFFKEHLNITG